MVKRRIIAALLAFVILANLAGCEGVAKKFRRKKKEKPKVPRIVQTKKYEKKPSIELYEKHYVYWMTWQSELISVLGKNNKKDSRCINEIVGNLKDMQNILVKEKADGLERHIKRLESVRDTIVRAAMGPASKDNIRITLEREDRLIKTDFSPKKMRNYLKKSFDEDESESKAEGT
ncbi:MAG: hypothetical protein PHP46_04355 [Candidatus Omnitrophica bacterium]|nr:hypothetical protein [Candidatus Omnitrophota bacterium]